jgi:5-methylcytosine-specific restriction endonuclease McrA
MQTKICTKCKRELPATTEYFAKLTRNKCGFRSECKECKKGIDHEWKRTHPKPKNPRVKPVYTEGCTKICTKCGVEYPATTEFFEPWKGGRYGVYSVCRVCRKGYNKEQSLKYYKLNRDKLIKNMKEYASKNIERRIEYYNKNKERISEKRRQYYKTDIGNQVRKKNKVKRKSAFKNLPINYTLDEWNNCLQYFNNCCSYCGSFGKLEQDHFVALSKGGEYTKNNIVSACKNCNSSKGNNNFFEWYPKQKFYSLKRERKILKYLNYKGQVQQLSIV